MLFPFLEDGMEKKLGFVRVNSHEEVGEWGTNLENRFSSRVFYHMYKKLLYIKHNKTSFTKKPYKLFLPLQEINSYIHTLKGKLESKKIIHVK